MEGRKIWGEMAFRRGEADETEFAGVHCSAKRRGASNQSGAKGEIGAAGNAKGRARRRRQNGRGGRFPLVARAAQGMLTGFHG